jgi:hypothetical protein
MRKVPGAKVVELAVGLEGERLLVGVHELLHLTLEVLRVAREVLRLAREVLRLAREVLRVAARPPAASAVGVPSSGCCSKPGPTLWVDAPGFQTRCFLLAAVASRLGS